jgi:hypothetical protein
MPSVLIGLPIMRGQLEPECMLALLATRRHLFMKHVQHHIVTNECSVISASRNALAEKAGHDYLMWVDSDIQFPPYGISRLMDRDKDVIGGLYFRKEKDARPNVFKLNDGNFFETIYDIPTFKEPFQCDGVGTGFMLIKRKVFEAFTPEVCEKLWYPFDLGRGPSNKEEGEDLSFCRRVKELGFEVWCDPTIPLGHIGRHIYKHEDFIAANQFKGWAMKTKTYNNEIKGWMTRMELNWLYDTAKTMDSIVEIGSWMGRSTHALLSGCSGSVTAVDTFQGSRDEVDSTHAEAKEVDIHAEFMKNVGEFTNLVVAKKTSIEAAQEFEDKSIDMVFIDGCHQYEDVKEDIQAWLPKAKKMICGHDYDAHSVQEAVTEIFGEVDEYESIWFVRLDK